jgi:hypothetical protein
MIPVLIADRGTSRKLRPNPPWSNELLVKNWDRIVHTVGLGCAPKLKKHQGRSLRAVEYGTGKYGVVIPSNHPGVVIKITSDETEARFVEAMLRLRHQPPGIVGYHALYKLEGVRRVTKTRGGKGYPVYIIWRDEAYRIGGWRTHKSAIQLATYLHAYMEYAYAAARIIWDSQKDIRHSAMRLRQSKYPKKSVDRQHINERKIKAEIRKHKNSADRLAYCIAYAESIAFRLAMDGFGNEIGSLLYDMIRHGVLMADVHSDNIGYNRQKDGSLVITDPGNVAFLKKDWRLPSSSIG